jgi:hypothetical protein
VLADPESPSAQRIVEVAERVAATRREQGVGIVKSLPLVS